MRGKVLNCKNEILQLGGGSDAFLLCNDFARSCGITLLSVTVLAQLRALQQMSRPTPPSPSNPSTSPSPFTRPFCDGLVLSFSISLFGDVRSPRTFNLRPGQGPVTLGRSVWSDMVTAHPGASNTHLEFLLCLDDEERLTLGVRDLSKNGVGIKAPGCDHIKRMEFCQITEVSSGSVLVLPWTSSSRHAFGWLEELVTICVEPCLCPRCSERRDQFNKRWHERLQQILKNQKGQDV